MLLATSEPPALRDTGARGTPLRPLLTWEACVQGECGAGGRGDGVRVQRGSREAGNKSRRATLKD